MVDSGGIDEFRHAQIIQNALQTNSFRILLNSYGHLYFNLTLIILFIAKTFSSISEQHIILLLRLIPALFAVATVYITYQFSRKFFGKMASYLSIIFLCIYPLKFLSFSIISHPDTLQIFFITFSIYASLLFIKNGHLKWMMLSGMMAGLAFSTKYAGIFVLPVLFLVVLLHELKMKNQFQSKKSMLTSRLANYVLSPLFLICISISIFATPDLVSSILAEDGSIDNIEMIHFLTQGRILTAIIGVAILIYGVIKTVVISKPQMRRMTDIIDRLLLKMLLILFIFTITFIITSPYLLIGFNFLSGIAFESRHIASGHLFEEHTNPFIWIEFLFSYQILGKFLFTILIMGLFLFVARQIQKKKSDAFYPEIVVLSFCFFYIGYLVFQVKMARVRYLLPILPFLIIFISYSFQEVIFYLTQKLIKNQRHFVPYITACLIIALPTGLALTRADHFKKDRIAQERTNPLIQAGKWLEEHCEENCKIFYDRFTYIPPKFDHVIGDYGGTIEQLEQFQPDIVVINRNHFSIFEDIHQAETYLSGENEFIKHHQYYQALRNGSLGYIQIATFGEGDVIIFKKEPD